MKKDEKGFNLMVLKPEFGQSSMVIQYSKSLFYELQAYNRKQQILTQFYTLALAYV